MNDRFNYPNLRAIRGPVMVITVGVLFALGNFTPYGFEQTWPVLIIVAGVLSLFGRGNRVLTQGPPNPPPYTSYQAPAPPVYNAPPPPAPGGYRQTPYAQSKDPNTPGGAV